MARILTFCLSQFPQEPASACVSIAAPIQTTSDPTVILLDFIHANMIELQAQPVDTAKLIESMTLLYRQANYRALPSFKTLLKDLKHHVKCREVSSHHFLDGQVRHATIFCKVTGKSTSGLAPQMSTAETNQLDAFLSRDDSVRGMARVEGGFTLGA